MSDLTDWLTSVGPTANRLSCEGRREEEADLNDDPCTHCGGDGPLVAHKLDMLCAGCHAGVVERAEQRYREEYSARELRDGDSWPRV